ncbi:hypothetical protein K6Y74_00785 [Burkholderia cenocepacia]|nr:hypothetical protein [Burkholderia cenocepacia]MBG0866649.1 hypothetical protein [Burkholderia sp. 9779_493]MBO1853619.1 hypothetical protein [Burkholderia cenocepacia]MBR7942483.1 hypothetical protein [Burkholderia cenocepacia]MBR8350947.1 hypothetical protein [Burkholderia cenocepacia]MCW3581528.1 hypothetical protein [Burkholderia cenocepacia]
MNVVGATTREHDTKQARGVALAVIHVGDAGQAVPSVDTPLRVAQRLHDRAPDFDTCPRRLVRGLIFGIEVISPGRFDSVFADPHVRHPRAAGCRLHGLDDDFVTVEYIAMAFDSFVHTVPLTCA